LAILFSIEDEWSCTSKPVTGKREEEMMNFTKALVGPCLALGLLSPNGTLAQEHQFTYASYATPGWANVESDMWLLDEIKSRSGGRIDFERYFGGSLMSPFELVPATGQNVIQIANVPTQYTPDLLPLSDVIQPFITDKLDAASRAYRRVSTSNEALKAEYEALNLKLLYTQVVSGPIVISNKKIEKTEDLAGMRIRAQSTLADMIREFGGTPVAMNWSESVDVFSSGGLDGLSSAAFDIAVISGAHELASHFWDLGGAGSWATVTTVMSMDAYNNLPPDLREIIDEVSLEADEKYLELLNKSIDDNVKVVANTPGLTVTTSTEAMRKEVRETGEKLREKWIEELEAKGVEARSVMEEYVKYVREEEMTSTFVPALQRLSEIEQ